MTQNITFCCPHCKHQYDDELEVLDIAELHEFRCENCVKPFQVLIEECSTCDVETVFVWEKMPPATVISQLSCRVCGNQFNAAETSAEQGKPVNH